MNITLPSIYPVACHTDTIGPGSIFVAIQGQKEDGVRYIPQALAKGACTIVVAKTAQISSDIIQAIEAANAQVQYVDIPRKALAELSAQAHGFPAEKLKIIAVTGTKGKTTSVFLLEHVMRESGYKTALLSTVKNKILNQEFPTNLTTQHPDYLHMFFAQCVQANVEYVIMEVAAQALSLHRITGLQFDGLIFTNFDQEHAEFYPTMEKYFAAKCAIIEQLKADAPCILNADDVWTQTLLQKYSQAIAISIQSSNGYRGYIQHMSSNGITLTVERDSNVDTFNCASLVGTYNAYNLLGVVSVCLELGLEARVINQALQSFKGVPGRLERYQLPNGAACFIDYAHNPSSFKAVLSMVRSLTSHLIVVFGAGGARDAAKRPMMGAIAAEYADIVIVTSDNPRSEDPQEIINQIMAGISNSQAIVLQELDRETAIKKAYALSNPESIIMLLGKGPDEYQIIGNQKLLFSEAAIVRAL